MEARLTAIEMTGTVDQYRRLKLDGELPIAGPRKVRVIVLYPLDEEWNESEWLYPAAQNPAFDYLKDPQEDICTLSDGKLYELN